MPAGRRIDCVTHYVAIVEEEEGKAVGVWFPDLPGCFSAGDTLDEAMLNAREALALYADALRDDGHQLPRARTLTELKADAEAAADIESYMVALIPFEAPARPQPMSAMPRKWRGARRSPSSVAPSRIALTGIRKVTSRRFVAPALASSRK